MAQKGRNQLNSTSGSKLPDNLNKEILARHLREVFEDNFDSFFNLVDDRLKDMKYEGNKTLETKLNESLSLPPSWGATQYFDVGSSNGSLSGSNEGIVSNIVYNRLSSSESEITINLNESISGKKVFVSVNTNALNLQGNSNVSSVVRYGYQSNQIKVGLRESNSSTQKVRLEVFVMNINQQ